MTAEHSKRKHSEFSASGAHRWMNCPGSVRLSRTAPPQVESKYAREGTEAHECLEFIVKRFSNLAAAAKQAKNKWPAEMVEHAVRSAELIFALKPSPSAQLLVETRVILNQISHRFYGTLDYAWLEDWGVLTVIDYKYGAGVPVLAFEEGGEPNPQLMYYAAGLAHKFNYEFEKVQLVIIQPRVWQEGDQPISVGEVTIGGIRKFEKQIKAAMAAANKPDAPLQAGSHCRWCPAVTICPETSVKAMERADIVFDLETTKVLATPEPMGLTYTNVGKLLDACNQLETWIGAVRQRAYSIAEGGQTIPGYKLVAKRSQRVWNGDAEQKAAVMFGSKIYDTDPQFLSPAKLEKAFGAKAKEFTAANTSQVSTGFNLVPASDRRSEVLNASDFDLDESL